MTNSGGGVQENFTEEVTFKCDSKKKKGRNFPRQKKMVSGQGIPEGYNIEAHVVTSCLGNSKTFGLTGIKVCWGQI